MSTGRDFTLRAGQRGDLEIFKRLQMAAGISVWTMEQWLEHLNKGITLCVDVDGKVLGFCAAQQTADVLEIHSIVIHENWRKRGLGGALLDSVLAQIPALNIFLEVEETNGEGVSFYRGKGFDLVRKRSNYYGPGRNALVMKKNGITKHS